MPLTPVELHHAYFWTCDRCGRDTFVRAITRPVESLRDDLDSISDADREAVEAWLESGGRGCFTMQPDQVTCGHCQQTYEVALPQAEDFTDETDH